MKMYRDTYELWLKNITEGPLRTELETIAQDEKAIEERFAAEMLFGTAGLRGIIGAGVSRMNAYTVGRATQGLADFIRTEGRPEMGMAIAYDSRRFSREFARRAAEVLAGNGIRVYIFRELTSVPELSFAVRYLKTFGGIVITASHNPKEYNGYKVYASYGGQLGPEDSLRVTEYIQKVDAFGGVKSAAYDKALREGLIVEVGREIDKAYYGRILTLVDGGDPAEGEGLKVAYTPLHGSGLRTVKNLFPAAGIKNLFIVERQAEPDGDFPTVKSPNPEDPSAMEMAVSLAKEKGADIALGTDPDADRMGAAVRGADGEYVMLTGNQIGCILTAYLLQKRKEKGALKSTDYIVKSFVSTQMSEKIAADYGVACHTVLTGFRFISEMIAENEGTGREFVFGFEESYGYLAGDISRDKDGALAGLLLAKAAAYYKKRGKTLIDVISGLYGRYRYFTEKVKSIAFGGIDGMASMKKLMETLRARTVDEIAGFRVQKTEDYLTRRSTDCKGIKTPIALPQNDALKYFLEGDAWACIRPSGTEPKLKIYFAASGDTKDGALVRLQALEEGITLLINEL
jgi:phosphoglucomutase